MLLINTIFHQQYQLQEQLSHYAGRQTWKAIDLATAKQEEVVIKLLAINANITWEAIKLFEREAQVLKNLEHPKIPNYRDYFTLEKQEDSDLTWLVTVQDYIPGISLKQWLDQHHQMTDKQVCKIASEILEILIYLHELSPAIIHRDIKPSNLILGEDGHIYLVDFGAVQDKTRQEGVTFTIVGSNGYAPPEQLWGQAIPASDLYALGATLIQLLTGKSPSDLLQNNRLQFTHEVELNPNLVVWLEQLTHPVPEKRIQFARQAYEQLKLILQSKPVTVNTTQNSLLTKIVLSFLLLFSTGISSGFLYITHQKYIVPQNALYHLKNQLSSIARTQQAYLKEKKKIPTNLASYGIVPYQKLLYKIEPIDQFTVFTYGIPEQLNPWTSGLVTGVAFDPHTERFTKILCITTSPITKMEEIYPPIMIGKETFRCAKGTKEYQ